MISLDSCNGSCNAVDDLFTKIYVSSETKDVNVKVFNMVTRINEVTTLVKHILCDYSTTCNSIKSGIMINANVRVKTLLGAQKIIFGILAHVFVKMINI